MLRQFFYIWIQQTFCRLFWCDSGAWIFLLNANFTSTRHPSLFHFYRKYVLNYKKKSQYHGKRFHISIYLMSGVMMITMKEESWIWETGSRINLRLAEVWAEKAEIGKNCWHWFPPAFLAILWTANKQARSELEISRQFHFPYWKIKVFSISEV